MEINFIKFIQIALTIGFVSTTTYFVYTYIKQNKEFENMYK